MKGSTKIIVITWALVCSCAIIAQKSASTYSIQFFSNEDKEPLLYTHIEVAGKWAKEADNNGVLRFDQPGMISLLGGNKNVRMIAKVTGFKTVQFSSDTLVLGDTIMMGMDKDPYIMQKIEMVGYKIPLISPRKKKRPKKNEKQDTAISYSEKELMDYHLLLNHLWKKNDSLLNDSACDRFQWREHLTKMINYPKRALDLGMEGEVSFSFEIDNKNYLQNMQLIEGKHPIFALEVIHHLEKMPRLRWPRDHYYPEPRPLEFIVTVSFQIRE